MKQVIVLAALMILTLLVLPAKGTRRVERMMKCTNYDASTLTCHNWKEEK